MPYTADFEKARARYVRVHFDVQVNTFLDEIEVYGGALTDDAAPALAHRARGGGAVFDDGADIGVRDIMCFHNGILSADRNACNNTKDVFASYTPMSIPPANMWTRCSTRLCSSPCRVSAPPAAS